MPYLQGFLVPVPIGGRQAYLDMVTKVSPVFAEFGATRMVECWGDDIADGRTTDMRRAVRAGADETIVFSWIWWPDRETCDDAGRRMMADERMKPDDPIPFDGQRMIHAGFDPAFDTGDGGNPGYVDGMVASVPDGDRAGFVAHARATAALFRETGALRIVDGWGVDVPDGRITDFPRAVQAKPGETVVFGWIEWPDKATREAGMGAVMRDERMHAQKPAWNGPLAIFGGFVPIFDTAGDAGAPGS